MKLKAPQGHGSTLVVAGKTLTADKNGCFEVEDKLIHSGLWQAGFVIANDDVEPKAAMAVKEKV